MKRLVKHLYLMSPATLRRISACGQRQVGSWIWLWLPAVLIAGASAIAWSDGGPAGRDAKPKPAATILADDCRIKTPQEVILAFDRPGILDKLVVEEGDAVEAGSLLASLKDDVARAALKVAAIQADSEIEIIYAQLAAAEAKIEHEKMVEGNKKKPGTTPELEVQRALLNFHKTEAEVEKAKHNRLVLIAKREEAAVQLDTYHLDAPFEGIVTKLHLVKGATVKQGDPVIELVNVRKVKVEGSISIKDVGVVRKGCQVVVQVHGDNIGESLAARTFTGKIVFIDEAKVLPVGEKVRVWAEVENTEKLLRDGLKATMTIQPAQSSD